MNGWIRDHLLQLALGLALAAVLFAPRSEHHQWVNFDRGELVTDSAVVSGTAPPGRYLRVVDDSQPHGVVAFDWPSRVVWRPFWVSTEDSAYVWGYLVLELLAIAGAYQWVKRRLARRPSQGG